MFPSWREAIPGDMAVHGNPTAAEINCERVGSAFPVLFVRNLLDLDQFLDYVYFCTIRILMHSGFAAFQALFNCEL